MASVFLSYDHEDGALARPIAAALEKAGHVVWYDRHIHGGAQYSRKIEQALDAADAVVVLWSPHSLESAWVRDEAAEGRDREKLVPLSLGGVTAPIGFRQFQTIALGDWNGRGKLPHLAELLQAVESQASPVNDGLPPATVLPVMRTIKSIDRRWLFAGLAVVLLSIAGFGIWKWLARGNLPVIAVASANASARSQAAASDLFVKLGALAQVGEGKWKLVDAASAPASPDMVFRTADTGSSARPQANLVLLDGKDDSLLWSREFSFPAGGEADLRQQLSLTAGRVLGCALESRDAGGLPRDRLKLFLNTCASMSELGFVDPTEAIDTLRSIVTAKSSFIPAWGRLLNAQSLAIDFASNQTGDGTAAMSRLRADIAKARAVVPDLPEISLAEVRLLRPNDYRKSLDLIAGAAERAPDNAEVFAVQAGLLAAVGRMNAATASARRAAGLDPLSPTAATGLMMMLAYGGNMLEARQELERVEKLWAGTGALRDAQWGYHLRFGDPETARRLANFRGQGLDLYLDARTDPSSANIEKLASSLRPRVDGGFTGFAIQALGEFNQSEQLFELIGRTKTDVLASGSYLLFRPALNRLRQDPRFMAVAKRIGLIDYWRQSGEWPDFCSDPALPYDCKTEAAKYG